MRQRAGVMLEAVFSALGIWGALGCVVTAFGWELPLAPLAVFCTLFALVTAVFRLDGKRYWAYMGCAAALLAFSWVGDAAVAAGMRELAYAVTKDYRVCYPQAPLLFSHGLTGPVPALSFLWWLAAALLLLSSLLRRWFWPQVLLTLPLLCLPLAVTRAPGALPLLALGVFWLTALCTARFRRRDPARAVVLQVYFGALSALFLILVGCLAGDAGAARPPWALHLQREVLSWGERLGGQLTATTENVPAAAAAPVRQNGRVDLSRQGPRSYTGRAMLELDTDYQGILYLRGTVSGAYTGSGWETPAETSEIQALYFPARTAAGDTWTATLTPRGDGTGVAYLPQYPWILEGAEMQGDRLALAVKTPYTVTFRPQAQRASLSLSGTLAEEEAAYAQNLAPWTDLPSGTEAALRAWAQEQGLETAGTPAQTAQRVADAVRAAAYYDLQTPRQPPEEDFALYFLTTARRGYCVHFATAATVLLRALGVPARYVQGYVLSSSGGVQMVPDSAAHAWVEYYVPGTGWLMLDATEGARAAVDGAVPAAAQSGENTLPQQTPAASGAAQQETPTVRFGTSGPEIQGAAAQSGLNGQTKQLLRELWRRFWAIPALLALAGLLELRRRWVLWRRKRPPQSRTRAVLKSWRRQELLCRGTPPPGPRARCLAEKAKFSNHGITEQELGEMLELEHQRARLCAAENGPLRRLADRWLLCLY